MDETTVQQPRVSAGVFSRSMHWVRDVVHLRQLAVAKWKESFLSPDTNIMYEWSRPVMLSQPRFSPKSCLFHDLEAILI